MSWLVIIIPKIHIRQENLFFLVVHAHARSCMPSDCFGFLVSSCALNTHRRTFLLHTHKHRHIIPDVDCLKCRLVPAAAMTRSTRRLRKRLAAAGIEFNMPLDPAGDQRDAQARKKTDKKKNSSRTYPKKRDERKKNCVQPNGDFRTYVHERFRRLFFRACLWD